MVKFRELGYSLFEEYFSQFLATLLPSNKTYEYFVDWRKVKVAAAKYMEELSLLNTLTRIKYSEREAYLRRLLNRHPSVAEVIPALIAERARKGEIDIFDPSVENIITFNFKRGSMNEENARLIAHFCVEVGLIELFDEIKDVHDYLLGVEVGIDTNTRKNRSGKLFERMCQQKISRLVGKRYRMIINDRNFSLYPHLGVAQIGGKTHDIVLYDGSKPKMIVECNFYNVTGSKPVSIAESYIEMNRVAQEHDVVFLWVTDGPAWHHMKEPLMRGMEEIDWVLNYRMLNLMNKIL